MLQCPTCGNADEFVVEEWVRQRSRIQCNSDGERYTWIEEEEFLELEEWGEIECTTCHAVSDEETLRECYQRAHDEAPIPYTLVDASLS